MNKIWDFFSSKGTPRWQLLLGGLFVACFGLLQNEVYYRRTLADAETAVAQQRVEAKIVEIQQQSIDFQTFANAYVTAILDESGEVAERRDILIANILAQDAAVDVARNVLGPSVTPQVETYRSALRGMKAAVEQVSDVVSMGPFWSAASDLLVARNSLLDALEKRPREASS